MTCVQEHRCLEHRDTEQILVEQILNDESLTSDLVDEAAQLLLDWGIAQLATALTSPRALSDAELDACASRLQRFMRRLNRRAGQAPPDQQAERVRLLLSRVGGLENGGGVHGST